MAIDSNIALRIQGPQIASPLDAATKALTMRQLAQQAQLQDRAIAEDQAIQDAFRQGMGPDGRVDRQATMSALAKSGVNPLKTIEINSQWAAQDRASQEAQRKAIQDQFGFIARAATSVRDEPSYQQALQAARQMGLDVSTMPQQWGPDAKRQLDFYGGMALTELERLGIQEKRANITKTQAETAKIRGEAANVGKEPRLTEGQKALDRSFAKEYDDWTSRGRAAVQKNLGLLEKTVQTLQQRQDDRFGTSGRVTGRLPDLLRSEESIRLREDVHRAVQSSLRATLGAQFTEKEGERIMSQAYNEKLSPAENIQKIQAAIEELRANAANADAKARYFEQQGTLTGYRSGAQGQAQMQTANAPTDYSQMSDEQIFELYKRAGGR